LRKGYVGSCADETEPIEVSIDAAEAVLDRLEADPEFAERVKDAGGTDSALALLAGEGFDVTPQEMRDAALDRFGDQLTGEQLDRVAAGFDAGVVAAGIGIGSILVVGAAMAAAV
jgi:predicted ribosomally synthesized peptide with nif11-like leader